jgi:integrator complex subunit 1
MCNLVIREAHNLLIKGDETVGPQLMEFFTALGGIQRDAVWWAHHVLQNMYRLQPAEYKATIRKILFLDTQESYSAKDNWPPESERSYIFRMMSDACLMEDTLMRVLVIGLTPELPLSPSDALDIADRLVARAANSHTTALPKVPTVERFELINAVLEISMYHAPSSVVLPEEYTPPQLAVSKLYWKGWVLLLVLSSFNPCTLGREVWREYPTLRGLMEMVMTRTYDFPPTTILTKDEEGKMQTREEALQRETELSQAEKECILEYEGYLASSTKTKITEKNSLMLNQVSLYSPKGPMRRVPSTVVDLIKTVNRSLKLGETLSSCRSPDFLLEIVQQQGTSQSMIWLSELVESSQESVEALPVPCLCEFLLANQNQEKEQDGGEDHQDQLGHLEKYKKKRTTKVKLSERLAQLVQRLRDLVEGVSATPQSSWSVLHYFIDKLSSESTRRQQAALKCLETVLVKEPDPLNGLTWFVPSIQQLKHLDKLKNDICKAFIKSCAAVMDVPLSRSLLVAIAQHTTEESALENLEELSSVLHQRLPMVQRALSASRDKVGSGPCAQEVINALLFMMANALPVAMVIGLQVEEDSPIPENHIALFRDGDMTGRIVTASLVKFCIQILLSIDPSKLGAPQKGQCERAMSFLFPENHPLRALGPSAQPIPLIDSSLRLSILQCSNASLVQQALLDSSTMDLVVTMETFGVPKSTIKLILENLDEAAVVSPASVEKCVLDPGGLSRAVELQIKRCGSSHGATFLKYLTQMAARERSKVKTEIPADRLENRIASEDMDQSSTPVDVIPSLEIVNFSLSAFEECLQLFIQRDSLSQTKLLNLLNQRSREYFSNAIDNLLKALRLVLSNLQSVPMFCNNPLSLFLLRNLSDIARESKMKSELLVPILQNIHSYSSEKGLSSISVITAHCLEELGHREQQLGSDKRKDFLVKFKRRLKDPNMTLGSHACTEDLKQVISEYPMDAEGVIKTISALAYRRGKPLEAAHMYRDVLVSMKTDGLRSAAGLLCDSIQAMIPDLVSTLHGLKLLMSLALSPDRSGNLVPGQRLFLSQLVHSTSWSSVYHLLSTMLSEGNGCTLHPTASLDFMWACINRPGLWRGVALKEGVVDPYLSIVSGYSAGE